MRFKGVISWVVLATLILCHNARAMHPGEYDGTEERFWPRFSVVVGKVISFDAAVNRAEVEVVGVAATDHIVWRTIHLNYFHARGFSNIFAPRPGEFYILCIFRKQSKWWLDDAAYRFMESGRAADKIEGVDDRKVARTLERIRHAREEGRKQAIERYHPSTHSSE